MRGKNKKKAKNNRVKTGDTCEINKSQVGSTKLETFQTTKSKLRSKNMYLIVILPGMDDYYVEDPKIDKDDIDDWLAENTVDFLAEVQLLWTHVTQNNPGWNELCEKSRKDLTIGYPQGVQYKWKSNRTDKAKVIPIQDYTEYMTFWLFTIVENEEIFPTDEDIPFPDDFRQHVRKMFKRMYRVFAIILANPCLRERTEKESHMMSCLRHFLYFGFKWGLLETIEVKALPQAVDIKQKFKKDEKLYLERKLPLDKGE